MLKVENVSQKLKAIHYHLLMLCENNENKSFPQLQVLIVWAENLIQFLEKSHSRDDKVSKIKEMISLFVLKNNLKQ